MTTYHFLCAKEIFLSQVQVGIISKTRGLAIDATAFAN